MKRSRTARLAAGAALLAAGTLVLAGCGDSNSTTSMDSGAVMGAPAAEMMVDSAVPAAVDAKTGQPPAPTTDAREIIRNGYLTLRVTSVGESIDEVHALVTQSGGVIASEDQSTGGADSATIDSATITAQVPAKDLDAFIDDVSALGNVESLNISAQDVTQQGVDLDARISVLKESLTRMNTLLAQASKIDDLLAIETQIAQRQAELDSLVAQRTWLSQQVAMSSVTVTLLPITTIADIEVPGFLSGLESGWSALVTLAKVSVTALGFLLPFLVIVLVIAIPLTIWLVRRARRRRQPAGQAVTIPPVSDSVNRLGE